MIDLLDSYDKSIILFLNYDGGEWVDSFWYSISGKFEWVGFYIFILVTLFLFCCKQEKHWLSILWFVIVVALLITLSDQISSGFIKHLVERPRPSHCPEIEGLLHYVNDYHGGRYGFVSSHAANTVGLATWLSLLFCGKFFRITIVIWALLICYSRMYLGIHYLGDILGGICVGILCALLIYYLYKKFIPKKQQITTIQKEPWLMIASIIITIGIIALCS